MKKRILAAVIAAVFAVLNVASALPVFALDESTMRYPTPEGYNDHDYRKLVAFLEQTDDEGVKNGKKLSENYDPNDPATWGTYCGDQRFQWIESDGELRIQEIYVSYENLYGALDVSGCTALEHLSCINNNLTTLDVSGCTALERLDCDYNNLTELDVSGCTALTYLSCHDNNLTSLDVSDCIALTDLYCRFNNLTEIVLEGTGLYDEDYGEVRSFDLIKSGGNGFVGIDGAVCEGDAYKLIAIPCEGYEFLGWYNETDEPVISMDECDDHWGYYVGNTYIVYCETVDEKVLIAKFGKVDGYYEHDYQKVVAFLEQTDEGGIKNGEKLNESYDPADPQTWTGFNNWIAINGKLRLFGVHIENQHEYYSHECLCGTLDLSDCTALRKVYCGCNSISEINLNGCTALKYLSCESNNLTELDLSHNPYLKLDFIKSQGDGTIGYSNSNWQFWNQTYNQTYTDVYAVPNNDREFIGWFNEADELVMSADDCRYSDYYGAYYLSWCNCEDESTFYDNIDETVLIAKFTEAEPIPGDADGDGELTNEDVLLSMRAVMELEELTDEMLANCDMNGDGVVNFTDALIMLRMVLNTQPNIIAY